MARPSKYTPKERGDYAREALALCKAGKNGFAKVASKAGTSESTVRLWIKFLTKKEQAEAKLPPKAPSAAKKPAKKVAKKTFSSAKAADFGDF